MRPPLPSPILAALLAASLTARPARAEPPAPAGSIAPRAVAPAAPDTDETRALRFTGGVSLTGLGLVTAVLGGVLAARAAVSKRDIGAHCDATNHCDLIGYSLASEAVDFSTTATALIPAGLGVAAAGAGLILSTKPWKAQPTAWATPRGGGVALVTRW